VDQAIASREPVLYHEITDDIIKSRAKDHEHLRLLREMEIKSALVIPMFIREKLFGILILIITESENRYDQKDLDFSKEISRRSMLAIENAQLYDESQKANLLLEDRVARRTHELETINKELEAFSYSVSHDLRAPLRSIDGFSNKILKDYSALLDKQGMDYFMRVMKASQHMGRLIDDLLKLSRLSRAEIFLERTDISALITSIVGEQKMIHPERNVEFVIQNHMVAKVDRSLMQIALQNLIENAWKYTKKNPFAHIEFSSFDKDGQTVYFIKDNGVGFDMKYVDKLFQSFQRLHGNSEFEGSGIGLAIVLRIIHRHHGTIWAEGEVNKGATFYFTL
jgi:light-regulated signal transduction histidine kinase (bacteriophytochrome)